MPKGVCKEVMQIKIIADIYVSECDDGSLDREDMVTGKM